MNYYVGIDVGGTFTDGVVTDQHGGIQLFKTPTTPQDPSQGFLQLLRLASEHYGLSLTGFLGEVAKLTYGTTLATNLLIEGKGAKAAFLTTKGFRDTLVIARIGREYLDFDLQFDKPAPLVPRHLIVEVNERVDYKGQVLTPLKREEVARVLEELVAQGIEALGVGMLWSFRNPRHEEIVREVVQQQYPELYLSLSHEVAPVLGEYERFATTAMNTLLGPPVARHLDKLSANLQELGLKVPLLLMQSNGGVIPARDAALRPVNLISSGPAGGVIAAHAAGAAVQQSNVIAVDMGGTSFDVSLINEGEFSTNLVSRAYDQNIYVPMIDVYSIGAGGGSIAWLDLGQRLKVGPQSAGSRPGPVCYGWGGSEPVVADADLVLGYLNPDGLAGKSLPLDREAAQAALEAKLGQFLGMTAAEVAAGIVAIVEAAMADAIRVITVEKGYDPRDYALVAYGGAGPVHAAALARELGIGTVIIPAAAGVMSAFGIMTSDITHSFSLTALGVEANPQQLAQSFANLEERGRRLLQKEGIAGERMSFRRGADVRYRGQVHEVRVPVLGGELGAAQVQELLLAFMARYEELYGKGSAYNQLGCEIVNLHLDAVGATPKPSLLQELPGEAGWARPGGERQVYDRDSGSFRLTPVYNGADLGPGQRLQGPAVVEYDVTTVVVLNEQEARVDGQKNLLILQVGGD